MKPTTLTVKNLQTLFGVTAMTIYNWKNGTTSKDPLPAKLTPTQVETWARKNGVPMLCKPATLLGVGVGRPGPKPKSVTPVKKSALRFTARRPSRSSSVKKSKPKSVAPRTAAHVLLGD